MRGYICLHYFLFTLHLFTSPIPVVSDPPFLNTLRDYSRKYRTVYRHFRARWSIDSGKRYRWQLWPKLRLVKYHPAAPETGGRRKRTEKKEPRCRERWREIGRIKPLCTRLSILFSIFPPADYLVSQKQSFGCDSYRFSAKED